MMSLTEISLSSLVKRQYRYKLKVHSGMFFTLMAAQLLAFLISLNGVATAGGSADNVFYTVKYISGDIIIIFTLLWALGAGISLSGFGFVMDFVFVSTRLSSHLSNLAFLATASVAGGVSASLCSLALRLLILYTAPADTGTLWVSPASLLSGIAAACFYAFLLSVLGYAAGMLAKRNKAFLLLPGLIFGIILVQAGVSGPRLILSAIEFFVKEPSLAQFIIKVMLAAAVSFSLGVFFTRRMEVRK